jgi:hypothetical protein
MLEVLRALRAESAPNKAVEPTPSSLVSLIGDVGESLSLGTWT